MLNVETKKQAGMNTFKSFLYPLLLSFFVFSCQKESIQPELAAPMVSAQMSPLRTEIISLDWDGYLVKWNQITPSERYGIWIEKLNEAYGMPKWNANQRDKIKAYKDLLSPGFFDGLHTDAQDSLMYLDACTVFSPREVARLFMDVYPFETVIEMRPSVDCKCRWSIWCGLQSDCRYGGCDITPGGCGMWGTAECKGLCDFSPNGM